MAPRFAPVLVEATTSGGDRVVAVVAVSSEADLIAVRQALRAQAEHAGLGLVDMTKLVTAGSELTRNILTYAGTGRVLVELVHLEERRGVRAVFADSGPGIEDIALAMTDGFSTRGSLGLGLPGARRLVDDMAIDSEPGTGTVVEITKMGR